MLTDILADTGFWAAAGPGLVTAVAAILLARWLAPRLRRVGHLVDDLAGAPARPGVPARPGLMQRVELLEARTAELCPNTGTSMHDQLSRLVTQIDRLDRRLAAVEHHLHPGTTDTERTGP